MSKLTKYVNAIKRASKNKPDNFSFQETDQGFGIEVDAVNKYAHFLFYQIDEEGNSEQIGQISMDLEVLDRLNEWTTELFEEV